MILSLVLSLAVGDNLRLFCVFLDSSSSNLGEEKSESKGRMKRESESVLDHLKMMQTLASYNFIDTLLSAEIADFFETTFETC